MHQSLFVVLDFLFQQPVVPQHVLDVHHLHAVYLLGNFLELLDSLICFLVVLLLILLAYTACIWHPQLGIWCFESWLAEVVNVCDGGTSGVPFKWRGRHGLFCRLTQVVWLSLLKLSSLHRVRIVHKVLLWLLVCFMLIIVTFEILPWWWILLTPLLFHRYLILSVGWNIWLLRWQLSCLRNCARLVLQVEPISVWLIGNILLLALLFGCLSAPEYRLPHFSEIPVKILLFVSGISTSNSIDHKRLFIVVREQLIFHWADVSQIYEVLVIWFDLSLKTEVPKLILNFILFVLLVNELEIPDHVLLKLVAFVGPDLSFLFDLHIPENLFFHI